MTQSNATPPTPFLQLRTSKSSYAASKPEPIYGVITFNPPALGAGVTRAPLDVAVAIDVSGSMNDPADGHRSYSYSYDQPRSGSKLDVAKQALHKLIDHLSPADQLSIVSFETMSRLEFHTALMTPANQKEAHAAVDRMHTLGGTNLSAGADLAAIQLQRYALPGSVRRLMVFTDGQANEGNTNPSWIRDAIIRRDSTIGVATFGVGKGVEADFLKILAREGAYYFIESINSLPVAFGTELGSMISLYARDVVVLLAGDVDKEFKIEVLNELPEVTQVNSSCMRLKAHELLAEQPYHIVVKLTPPKLSKSRKTPLTLVNVSASMTDIRTGGKLTFEGQLEAIPATVKAAASAKEDTDVMSIVSVQLAAQAQRAADVLAKQGNYKGAQARLRTTANFVSGYNRQMEAVTKGLIGEVYSDASTYQARGAVGHSVGSSLNRSTANTSGQAMGGVSVDALFASPAQKRMANAFAITKSADDDDMPDLASMLTQ